VSNARTEAVENMNFNPDAFVNESKIESTFEYVNRLTSYDTNVE
jgi:hypothetical protein